MWEGIEGMGKRVSPFPVTALSLVLVGATAPCRDRGVILPFDPWHNASHL